MMKKNMIQCLGINLLIFTILPFYSNCQTMIVTNYLRQDTVNLLSIDSLLRNSDWFSEIDNKTYFSLDFKGNGDTLLIVFSRIYTYPIHKHSSATFRMSNSKIYRENYYKIDKSDSVKFKRSFNNFLPLIDSITYKFNKETYYISRQGDLITICLMDSIYKRRYTTTSEVSQKFNYITFDDELKIRGNLYLSITKREDE